VNNTLQTNRRPSITRTAAVLAAILAAPAAMAQTTATNAGVAEVVNAIEGLAPDMGFVVVAGIGLALIGLAAVAALGLAKRFFGGR
jgi:hypothetical protein